MTPISAFEPKRQNVTSQDIISQNNTSVHGRNPAITRWYGIHIPLFTGFYTSEVVTPDFFHQHYNSERSLDERHDIMDIRWDRSFLEQNHNFITSKSPSQSPASLFVTLNVSIIVGMKDGYHLRGSPHFHHGLNCVHSPLSCKTESRTYRAASTTSNFRPHFVHPSKRHT